MARTPTTQIDLGFKAPNFSLPDVTSGKDISFSDVKGERGTLVMFICNHCPFVIHVKDELVRLANDYRSKGFGFVAISSNDVVNYPQDSPEKMKEFAKLAQFPFPYLYDETQEVAKAYDAACTPDFSLFDREDVCVYRGQLDDSRPGNGEPVDGHSLREVFDLMLNGSPVPQEGQRPSIGCNIKWK
ncbi:MAG: thioredoxin family protein [Flavobacteriales bacterium]|nr:thioredoxin family protein [Flavobacteriales bacterium]